MRAQLRSNPDVLQVLWTLKKHYFEDRRPIHTRTIATDTKENLTLLCGLFGYQEEIKSSYHVDLDLSPNGIEVIWSPHQTRPILTTTWTSPDNEQYVCAYFAEEEAYVLVVLNDEDWREATDDDEANFIVEGHFNNLEIITS